MSNNALCVAIILALSVAQENILQWEGGIHHSLTQDTYSIIIGGGSKFKVGGGGVGVQYKNLKKWGRGGGGYDNNDSSFNFLCHCHTV